MARILDYVSPAELERFENQDFLDEDERERLLPPKKPRGRPRKGDSKLPSFSVAPTGEETSREQSLLPEGSFLIKKRRGRPKGSFRKNAVKLTSTKPSGLSEPSIAIKKPRGRPPRQKNLSIVIPTFHGPQPQHLESSPGTQSGSDEILVNPKPQYSMLAASGLGQTDSEDLTSRDQSVELMPSLKKRRLNTENASIDPILEDHDDNRSSTQPKRAKTFSDMSPDPIANDSIALLRQFQARVYGPDNSKKGNSIPHRQGKPSLTNEEIHFHTPRSSLDSSSSDSLMGHIPSRLERLPTEYVRSKPLPGENISQSPPGNISTQAPTSQLENNITASHSPHHHGVDSSPTRSTSPSKSIRRKASLTPHFPPSLSSSHEISKNDSVESGRSQPSVPPASRHMPQNPIKPMLSQITNIPPSIEKKRNPSPQRRNPPSQSSQASSSNSKLGFAGLPRAKHITDYFAPKPTPTASNPPPIAQPRHSPSSQLLGPTDSNNRESDSEDQLARDPSPPSSSSTDSDSDSISSEVMIVRPPNRITTKPHPTTQAARSQDPSSNHHDHEHEHETDTDSSEDDEDDHDVTSTAPAPEPSTTPIVQSTTTTTARVRVRARRSAGETLNRAFKLDDDDDDGDGDGESDSDSDSSSSEVMIIRPG